jgi:hypothetical protein
MKSIACTRKEYAVVVRGMRPNNTRSKARSYISALWLRSD